MKSNVDSLADLIHRIDLSLERGEIDLMDRIMGELSRGTIQQSEVGVPVTWLRTTFMFRDRFKNWTALRDRMKRDFDGYNWDSAKILRGLYT